MTRTGRYGREEHTLEKQGPRPSPDQKQQLERQQKQAHSKEENRWKCSWQGRNAVARPQPGDWRAWTGHFTMVEFFLLYFVPVRGVEERLSRAMSGREQELYHILGEVLRLRGGYCYHIRSDCRNEKAP